MSNQIIKEFPIGYNKWNQFVLLNFYLKKLALNYKIEKNFPCCPLSISDIYTKLFEKLVLPEIQKDHKDHHKQFGFKANSSCDHANFILSEIVRLNKKRKQTTYIISIDASKAFEEFVEINSG